MSKTTKLKQLEKNILFYALERVISERLKKLSADVMARKDDYCLSEIDDIKADMELWDKLATNGWGVWEGEE